MTKARFLQVLLGLFLMDGFGFTPSVLAQSTLDTYLAGLDTNHVILRLSRESVDSCWLKKRAIMSRSVTNAPNKRIFLSTAQEELQITKQRHSALRQKVWLTTRLTCIDLIYQRKRHLELTRRRAVINALLQSLSRSYQAQLSTFNQQALKLTASTLTLRLAQKEGEIARLQHDLLDMQRDKSISFPDSVYPVMSLSRHWMKKLTRISSKNPEYDEWRQRYTALNNLFDVYTTFLAKRPAQQLTDWEFKGGYISAESYISSFTNTNQLIDNCMRTERDIHVALAYLLAFTIPLHSCAARMLF